MKISYSAPFTVTLSGEHAVLYGKPMLVTAVNQYVTCTVHDEKTTVKKDIVIEAIEKSVVQYLKKHNISFTHKLFSYEVESDRPISQELGLSSAFLIAATAAILQFFTEKEFEKAVINSVAYEAHKKIDKNSLVAELSASCYGGLIYYRKEFEFLKQVSALNFKIPQNFQDRLVLIEAGKPDERETDLVELVGKRFNQHPKETQDIFNEIEKITKRMVISIATENIKMFQESLADNQRQLESLGVVSDSIKKLLADLKPYGVGKISGASGSKYTSGYLIFITNEKVQLPKKVGQMRFHQSHIGVTYKQISLD